MANRGGDEASGCRSAETPWPDDGQNRERQYRETGLGFQLLVSLAVEKDEFLVVKGRIGPEG